MQKKTEENIFTFWDNCIWIGYVKLCVLRAENLLSAVNLLTNSLKIFHISKRDFLQLNFLKKWSINMVKFLSFRFPQCFDPSTMLILEGTF